MMNIEILNYIDCPLMDTYDNSNLTSLQQSFMLFFEDKIENCFDFSDFKIIQSIKFPTHKQSLFINKPYIDDFLRIFKNICSEEEKDIFLKTCLQDFSFSDFENVLIDMFYDCNDYLSEESVNKSNLLRNIFNEFCNSNYVLFKEIIKRYCKNYTSSLEHIWDIGYEAFEETHL
jgi:hypothetical protein